MSSSVPVYTFHVTIHRLPQHAAPGDSLTLRGEMLPALSLASTELAVPFGVTFEATEELLSEFERLYCEPDGSFVWVSGDAAERWQVDGHLYDRAERLLYMELKGSCPVGAFDRLLAPLGWPAVPLAFLLVREAVVLNEAAFRRYAAASPPPSGAVR